MNDNNGIITIATTNFRNAQKRFGIRKDDRRRHMYLIGKTGMGKSTVLENMIIQDIQAGRGIAVVDPHGDLIEKIVKYIPSNRINDVIYFNPADLEYPIAFNVLESVDLEHRHLVSSGLIGVFKKIWADTWGPRLEYVLRNAILALLEYPGSTLLGIMRMLTDKVFRKKVIEKISDPVVKAFWVEEYSKYPDRFQAEAIAPIQNKVGAFLSSALIRNIVGQVKSTINLREIMDKKKILLLNLSKGRMGEDNSALLGAMMITKIQLAAMSRVDIPEEEREDFYLYVDEFQNFATESFANILSEARKYRLNLIIAHQYIEQLSDEVRSAVFGNVGTLISFRVGAEDAEFLAKEYAPRFDETDLVNITKYEFYLKLMIDGVASEPFSATGLPPFAGYEQSDNLEKVLKVSREKYTKPRENVEERIARWSINRERESSEDHRKQSQTSQDRVVRPRFFTEGRSQRPAETRRNYKKVESMPTSSNFDRRRTFNKPSRNISENKIKENNRAEELAKVIEKEIPPAVTLMDALKNAPISFKSKKKTNQVAVDRPEDQEIKGEEQTASKKINPGEVVKF
jgi:hypothetical protein